MNWDGEETYPGKYIEREAVIQKAFPAGLCDAYGNVYGAADVILADDILDIPATNIDTGKSIIEKAIRAMIKTGVIKFKSFSNYRGVVDVEITSDVFTEKSFMTSVYEDEWNNYPPARAVAAELADLIMAGKIEFVPLMEG